MKERSTNPVMGVHKSVLGVRDPGCVSNGLPLPPNSNRLHDRASVTYKHKTLFTQARSLSNCLLDATTFHAKESSLGRTSSCPSVRIMVLTKAQKLRSEVLAPTQFGRQSLHLPGTGDNLVEYSSAELCGAPLGLQHKKTIELETGNDERADFTCSNLVCSALETTHSFLSKCEAPCI
jgi:hypothetical protein